MSGRASRTGERARLKPFTALPQEDARPRDQRDLMERPFFSLAKAKRTTPILYRAGRVEVQVFAVPEHGMATIWDADVLIWAATQLVEAADDGRETSRLVRFVPYQLLTAIGRGTGFRQYRLLRASLQRLQSTVVATSIRQGAGWRRRQFSWISEWEELVDGRGRCRGMELVLPEWFYDGVLDRRRVLTIDPAYFRLTGGLERWLYRVARKHAGWQRQGWAFELRHLHAKSGSLARFADFALDLRRIARRQPLPGYLLRFEHSADGEEVLRILPSRPNLSTGPVDAPVSPLGTSGAAGIGTSGARPSVLRAHGPASTLWTIERIGARNFSNPESNLLEEGAGGTDNNRTDRIGDSRER